ncbi:hypothetical protein AgCh_027986 [Apium graveolens]
MGIRKSLHPVKSADGKKLEIFAAIFDMTNKEKEQFCKVLKNVKLPYICASNISLAYFLGVYGLRTKPEGSIAEGYFAEECVTFYSRFLGVESTNFGAKIANPEYHIGTRRNKDGKVIQLNDLEWKMRHTYILFNCGNQEIETLIEMEEKCVTLNLHYGGIFKKTTYHGGQSFIGNRLDTSEFSYSVLMEYVKDYMKLTEIGGVYTKAADGWKLLTCDKELLDLVNETKPDHELHLYVDTVIDKEVEPSVQMQPWVIIRPRKNHIFTMTVQYSFTGSTKKQVKLAETPELEEGTVNPKGTSRRKLNLQGDKINGKSTGKNDITVKLPKQPSQCMNKYELLKMKCVQENRAKFDELGLGKYETNPTPPTVQNVKGKEKDNEVSDEYVLENERKSDSDDSPKATTSLSIHVPLSALLTVTINCYETEHPLKLSSVDGFIR